MSDTRVQDYSSVIRLKSPFSPSVKFCLPLSGDPEAVASDFASVGVALNEQAEGALLEWFPVDLWLCTMRLGVLCKTNNHTLEDGIYLLPQRIRQQTGSQMQPSYFLSEAARLLTYSGAG